MFEIIIPISEHLHPAELDGGACRTSTRLRQPLRNSDRVAERLLAFDSLCEATARATERLLAYYRRLRTSGRLLQSFPNFYLTPTVTAELERGLPNMY